jgi:hypothetical protein
LLLQVDRRYIDDAIEGDRDGLAERVARTYVERIDVNGPDDPFVAIIRSAGGTEVPEPPAGNALKLTAASAKALDAPGVQRRSDLVGALFIGVAFSRHVLTDGTLSTMSSADLIAALIPPHAVDPVRPTR